MKALVSIQFALELDDEDQLVTLARTMDESMYESIKRWLSSGIVDKDTVELMEIGGVIDWYGASVSIKRPVFADLEVGG